MKIIFFMLVCGFSCSVFAEKNSERKTASGMESYCGYIMKTETISPYLNISKEKAEFCFSMSDNKRLSQKGIAPDIQKGFCLAGNAALAGSSFVLNALN